MAQGYAREVSGVLDGTVPAKKSDGHFMRAGLHHWRASIDWADTIHKGASGDTNVLFVLPVGFVFSYGVINTDTSLGTTTVAIGNSGTPAKYKAAAVFTATNTPTLFGKTAPAAADPSTAAETVIMTLAAADGPASGLTTIDFFGSLG